MGQEETEYFFRATLSVVGALVVVGGSGVEREEVGVAELVVGGVLEEGESKGGILVDVTGGGALVLRIRSTLILATIRIISISPTKRIVMGRTRKLLASFPGYLSLRIFTHVTINSSV